MACEQDQVAEQIRTLNETLGGHGRAVHYPDRLVEPWEIEWDAPDPMTDGQTPQTTRHATFRAALDAARSIWG